MKIGKLELHNRVFLAPMAGITDLAFREIVKPMGVSLVYTEMISAEGLIRGGKNTKELLAISESERPVAMQIFGSNPDSMAEAAKILNGITDVIDINCGCSVKKVLKSGSGAALLKDLGLLEKILVAVVKSSKKPVTIKIRSGWDEKNINAVETAKLAESCGISAIAVHARTRTQGFSGKADWNIIKEVKESVKIPVIGNGDIKTGIDAEKMFKETACDAIMVGRACMGNPWVFKEIIDYLENKKILLKPDISEKINLIDRHAGLMVKYKGEKRGLKEFRKHLHWYFKGIRGAKDLRNSINCMKTMEDFSRIIQKKEKGELCSQAT